MSNTVVVVDFETTGAGPDARATEIALVRVHDGRIAGHYASLMHTGVPVPAFVQRLTGISNEMLDEAPPAREVMEQALAFAGTSPLVAHNASFDRGFWLAEARRAGSDESERAFACTVKLARRLYPEAPNHRLGTLAAFHGLQPQGRAHRALADALTTALLWQRLQADSERLLGRPVDAAWLLLAQNQPLARWQRLREREEGTTRQPHREGGL